MDAGTDAVLVSNHGGRQLDGTCSSAAALPAVVAWIGDRANVYVDIGRAYLYGLGAEGEAGVTKALELIHKELSTAMALTGVTDLGKLPPDLLLPPQQPLGRTNAKGEDGSLLSRMRA